jgi:hypothetical protein
MAYTAPSRQLPKLGPVPGLLVPGAFLVGWTDRRAARALAARLAPAFDGWRGAHDARVERVELCLTLPPRLRHRMAVRERRFTRWVSLALRWAAADATGHLPRSAVAITVTYAYGAARWGEAMVRLEFPDPDE